MTRKFFLRTGKIFFLCFMTLCLPAAREAPAEIRTAAVPPVRVIFVGDVMAHKEQIEAAKKEDSWDFSPQFRRVKPLFENALVVGNLETVFAGEKSGYAGYPSFNTPDVLANALTDLGMSVVTLANNHILDRGTSGAARTIEVLNSAGLLWTGLSSGDVGPNEALSVDYKGIRWAFVNFSYGSNRVLANPSPVILNTLSDAAITEGLNYAHLSSPDVIAACFHWGNEYQYTPTRRQREIAELCIEQGADLVIGTHPHVLQPVEIVSSDFGVSNFNVKNLGAKDSDANRKRHVVAYSLGNFVSYQRTLPRERSIILAVDVEKKPEGGVDIVRVAAAPTWTSVTRLQGKRRIEVVYAGESARFNHAGLPVSSLKTAQSAGRAVLDFLGARGDADEKAFYTLWDAASPDVLPAGNRKSPR